MSQSNQKSVEYLIMCIGNRDGGDDGIGPYIADILENGSSDVVVLNCETVPENYTSVVKQYHPKNLIIIDAVDMGLEAGEFRIVPREKIGVMHISTHGIPISVLMEYLKQYVEHITLIGIQPGCMSGGLSDEVQDTSKKVIEIINQKSFDQISLLST